MSGGQEATRNQQDLKSREQAIKKGMQQERRSMDLGVLLPCAVGDKGWGAGWGVEGAHGTQASITLRLGRVATYMCE